MVEIQATEEFEAWYMELSRQDTEAVDFAVELLQAKGVTLGHPYSSDIKGTKLALRELIAQSGGRPLRIFYAFDPLRRAVLLLGGDKTGDQRFYETFVPRAERIWREYLAGLEEEGKKK